MATLDKIKQRIKSIKSTSKITKAMELVATAKIKKAREDFEKTLTYYSKVLENVSEISSYIENTKNKHLIEVEGDTIWIVLSSDLGLCGGYNNSNIKLLKKLKTKNDAIVAIGQKAQTLVKSYGLKPDLAFTQVVSTFNPETSHNIIKKVMSLYNSDKNFTNIKLIASKYINNITYEPRAISLLPLSKLHLEDIELKKEKVYKPKNFEQDPVEILINFIPMFLEYALYAKIKEARLIEQVARRLAMEAATKNANELLDELKIQYNSQRQANITQEISEIIAGANA